MGQNKRVLAMSLLASLILVGTIPLRPASSRPRMLPTLAAQQDKEQKNEADAERKGGQQALRRGLAGEALVRLEKALKLYAQGGDKSGEAATEDLLGELYEQQGRYNVALEHFERAHKIYTSLSDKADDYNANLMLAKIGNMRYRQDDLGAARGAFMRMKVKKPSLASFRKENIAAQVGSGLGKIMGGGRGRQIEAAAVAANAALTTKQMFAYYRQTILYAGYETGLGRVNYLSSNLEQAGTHFKNALAATESKLPLLGKLGQTRRFRIAAYTGLGDVTLAQGNYKKAVELYDEAAGEAGKEKRLDLMWPAQRGLGRSYWKQAAQEADAKKREKLRIEALDAYRAALKSIEALRAGSLRSDEARATFLATTEDVFDEAADALAEMALSAAPTDAGKPLEGQALAYAAEAFAIVEQGRARSLLDLLGATGTNIKEGVPEELFERKQKNLDEQARVARELLGVSSADKSPSKSIEALEKEADDLQDKYVSIENEIQVKSPRYKALTAAQPLTLAEVRQQVLDEETALLEYNLGPQASYLWAVTRDAVRLFKLPARAEINAQADELRRQMLPPNQGRSLLLLTSEERERGIKVRRRSAPAPVPAAAFVAAAHKLYKSVLEQAVAHLGTRRLLIVPDGALSFIPFEALVTEASGTDYAALPYLVRTKETVYAPSASVVAAVRQQRVKDKTPAQPPSILIIADPVFDSLDERAQNLPAGATASRGLSLNSAAADLAARTDQEIPPDFVFQRLQGTRDEALQIGQTAGAAGLSAVSWFDLEASEANVEGQDLRQYSVLHLATHGVLNAERPQFTGVVLSLVGNKESTDGFLRTDEVFNLRLGAPLVMLSACETGLGRERRGEGVMGLTRAFMYAGAPAVGVSLWSVADNPTAELMADFYRNLLAKDGAKPATAALHAARKDMIADGKYSAPYYWAPFILVGDWR